MVPARRRVDVARLASGPGNHYGAVWPPDGKKIAFTRFRDDNAEVYAMNADGTAATSLTFIPWTTT